MRPHKVAPRRQPHARAWPLEAAVPQLTWPKKMARLSSAGGSPVTRSHRQAGGSKGHTASSWMHWYIVFRAWRPSGLSKLKAWREGPARRSPCSHRSFAVASTSECLRQSLSQKRQ